MTKREAWAIVGGLGRPSKMPGWSYGLPVAACRRGRQLAAREPKSPCAHCYADDGFYKANASTVLAAQRRRLVSLSDPRWVDAMSLLLADQQWFRWHDSGDLQSVLHLTKIVDVAWKTTRTNHWLPTHEPDIVATYLRADYFPSNLCVRISSDVVGCPARPVFALSGELPTSTVHLGHGNRHRVGGVGIECKAYTRGNACGKCRACWDSRVDNVSYPAHGFRPARLQLPLVF